MRWSKNVLIITFVICHVLGRGAFAVAENCNYKNNIVAFKKLHSNLPQNVTDILLKKSSQVTQEPFLLTSVEIEMWLRQSTSFRGLTCKSSRLSLDPKIWHGSYFYLEIRVCKFLKYWKMYHLPILSLMRNHSNLKMFRPKFFPLRRTFITIPKMVLDLQKTLHRAAGSAAWRVSKYVRVDTRFQFTITWFLSFPKTVIGTIAREKISDDCRIKSWVMK